MRIAIDDLNHRLELPRAVLCITAALAGHASERVAEQRGQPRFSIRIPSGCGGAKSQNFHEHVGKLVLLLLLLT